MRRFIAYLAILAMSVGILAFLTPSSAGSQPADRSEDLWHAADDVKIHERGPDAPVIDDLLLDRLKSGEELPLIVTFETKSQANEFARSRGDAQEIGFGFAATRRRNLTAVRQLANNPNVVRITEDIQLTQVQDPEAENSEPTEVGDSPNDGYFKTDNGLVAMNVDDVWTAGYTGDGETIVIVGDGVQPDHEDFEDSAGTSSRVVQGACFLSGSWNGNCPNGFWTDTTSTDAGDPCDYETLGSGNAKCDHETYVASAAAGRESGVAIDADILPVMVVEWYYDSQSSLYKKTSSTSMFIKAIEHALDEKNNNGVNVTAVNYSWGSAINNYHRTEYSELNEAIMSANFSGIAVVTSAGNNWQDTSSHGLTGWPATETNIIAVAAYDHVHGTYPWFASMGHAVANVAPGMHLTLADKDQLNAWSTEKGGSSFASPMVSGMLTLLADQHPNATVGALRRALVNSGGNKTDSAARGCPEGVSPPTCTNYSGTGIARRFPDVDQARQNVVDHQMAAGDDQFWALPAPERIVDTRYSVGVNGGDLGESNSSGTSYVNPDHLTFDIYSAAGLRKNQLMPEGFLVNLTLIGDDNSLSWLTVRQPGASNFISTNQIPSRTGDDGYNLIDPMTQIITPNASGRVQLELPKSPTGDGDILIDLIGVIPAGSDFVPMNCRAYDTRSNWPSAKLSSGQTYSLGAYPNAGCVPPADAKVAAAYSIFENNKDGWSLIWKDGTTKPNVSTMNPQAGEVDNNMTFVQVGSDSFRRFNVRHDPSGGTYHFIFDIMGYWPSSSSAITLATPSRLYDSRYHADENSVPAGVIAPGSSREIDNGAGTSTDRVTLTNLLTLEQDDLGAWQKLWNTDVSEPNISITNSSNKDKQANAAAAGVGTTGHLTFKNAGAGDVHAIVDYFGYLDSDG